ncbi:MAG: sigma-70 family RNA polymerase sigma factor [Gammaproteobacteria bacterium]
MTDDIAALFKASNSSLVRRLTPLVNCRELARDIVAESFVVLVRKSSSQPIVRPLGFLYRTAMRLALDHLKHGRVTARYTEAVASETRYEDRSPEQIVDWHKRIALFQSALSELRPPTDEVFLLVKLEGLSHRDVAARLGLSMRQVERHMLKAMLHCRERLKDS